jgi:hydroxyacylglutathione hydrolase
MLDIWPIQVFSDNYVWVLQQGDGPGVVVVDPGDGLAVLAALENRGLSPSAVLITHHHADHVGGIDEIVERFSVPVFGPAAERIEFVDHPVADGDAVAPPGLDAALSVMAVPGHTAGHVAYAGPGFVLCGDTLFAGGCGRIFEGTPEEMFQSLGRLSSLPEDTLVYCAHEYTMANLGFAMDVEPGNGDLQRRQADAASVRERNEPTVPSTLSEEHHTNPFLRCHVDAVKKAAEHHSGQVLSTDVEVFAVVRSWKDGWQG